MSSIVAADQLQLTWTYSEQVHQRATIERLANEHLAALHALIAACRAQPEERYRPSDFPKARLSQKDLDSLLAQIGQENPG